MKYKCIKSFVIDIESDDKAGSDVKRTVPEGSIWKHLESASAWLPEGMISMNRNYKENGQEIRQWIEIGEARLKEYFEAVEE